MDETRAVRFQGLIHFEGMVCCVEMVPLRPEWWATVRGLLGEHGAIIHPSYEGYLLFFPPGSVCDLPPVEEPNGLCLITFPDGFRLFLRQETGTNRCQIVIDHVKG